MPDTGLLSLMNHGLHQSVFEGPITVKHRLNISCTTLGSVKGSVGAQNSGSIGCFCLGGVCVCVCVCVSGTRC